MATDGSWLGPFTENDNFSSPAFPTHEIFPSNPGIPPDGPTPNHNCTLSFPPSGLNPVTASILGLYLAFGLLCAFLGYRVFKALMFLTGFVFGSLIVYLICLQEKDLLTPWSSGGISVGAGILFGLITLLVQYVGLFMLGFHTGLLTGIGVLCLIEFWYIPPSPWITLTILLALGLIFSLFNLCFQKCFTVFGSAFYGGAIIATVVDYFVENSIMLIWVWNRVKATPSSPPCWYSWAVLAIWPTISILGIVTQCVLVGEGTYHEQQFPPRKTRAKPETREERKQRKYRYLYQVRTCHGDVISQPIAKKYVHQVNDETFA